MKSRSYLTAAYRIRVTCASPGQMLQKLNGQGIELWDVTYVDELTLLATVGRQDFRRLKGVLEANGNTCKLVNRIGSLWLLRKMFRRPVLLVGLVLYCLFVCYLPTRILFVQVEGNQRIPTRMILESAEACGITFGASRREVRSERMKNALLGSLPGLQWACVNTNGCVAVISVRERCSEENESPAGMISSIVSKSDCVIRDVTVVRGNALCAPGQAVKAGQVLVSGYTDCGISVRAERSEAEILGETRRTVTAKYPADMMQRGEPTRCTSQFSLLIGKNIINLTKGSGISGACCVKMYSEYYLLLPGGFRLPVSLMIQTVWEYELQPKTLTDEADFLWLPGEMERHLLSDMQAGSILHSNLYGSLVNGCYIQYGKYSCLEQVGQMHIEEILEGYGERYGADR